MGPLDGPGVKTKLPPHVFRAQNPGTVLNAPEKEPLQEELSRPDKTDSRRSGSTSRPLPAVGQGHPKKGFPGKERGQGSKKGIRPEIFFTEEGPIVLSWC